MKVIFLDIDGVIATPTSLRLNYLLGRGAERQWYDAVSLTYLGRLVAATNACVVLTSTWRADLNAEEPFLRNIMANVLDQLAQAGAPVCDVTPVLPNADRSEEIGAWLDEHPCERYVIFDDLACFDKRPEVSAGHIVLIADSAGIRHRHYYEALAILSAP